MNARPGFQKNLATPLHCYSVFDVSALLVTDCGVLCVYDTKVTGKTLCPHHVSVWGEQIIAPFTLNFDTRWR